MFSFASVASFLFSKYDYFTERSGYDLFCVTLMTWWSVLMLNANLYFIYDDSAILFSHKEVMCLNLVMNDSLIKNYLYTLVKLSAFCLSRDSSCHPRLISMLNVWVKPLLVKIVSNIWKWIFTNLVLVKLLLKMSSKSIFTV